MADGIQIRDASFEISPEGVDALVNRTGAEVKVTRLDLSVSPEALNRLLAGVTPEGKPAPNVAVSDGRLQLNAERDGKRVGLDLQLGGLRLEFSAEGLRLVGGEKPAE
jgi:hypothetical protein